MEMPLGQAFPRPVGALSCGAAFVVTGAPPKQIVVIQWESLEKAQAFFESEAYKQVIPIRDKSSNFRAFVIEGVAQ
jgi:uncharacterized protein (DUF1330 family)